MSVILHITKREEWERAKLAGVYRGDTLESEGFIHCSEPQQVIPVANTWFPGQKGLTGSIPFLHFPFSLALHSDYKLLVGPNRFLARMLRPYINGMIPTDTPLH